MRKPIDCAAALARGRWLVVLGVALHAAIASAAAAARPSQYSQHLVILGFDGMDPALRRHGG